MQRYSPAELHAWARELLTAWGYSASSADFLAESLLDANLRGVDSHGLIRLPAYERRVRAGLVSPDAQPTVAVRGALVTVEANRAAGQIAMRCATDAASASARDGGVSVAVVRGSAHFGSAGFYARKLALSGFVGIVMSNSEPIVVPHGGREALLGTNPLAFAAPTDGDPLSLDMATSTSAMGKVLVAQNENRAIPADWGVTATGEPTTDPREVAALLPAAGPKGYGLAFLVEILAGVLSGSAVADQLGNMYTDFDRPQDVGHWLLALDVQQLMPISEFTKRIAHLIERAHAVAPVAGFAGVQIPGEPEERMLRERARDGIPIDPATAGELATLGSEYERPFPDVWKGTAHDQA